MMAERQGSDVRKCGNCSWEELCRDIFDSTLRRDRWNTVQHTTSGMHHHLCSVNVERGPFFRDDTITLGRHLRKHDPTTWLSIFNS